MESVALQERPVVGSNDPIGDAVDHPGRHEAPEPSLADRRAAGLTLGVLFVGAGLAHLLHRRLHRSAVPDWLSPVRRELDATADTVEALGAIALVIDKLRQPIR